MNRKQLLLLLVFLTVSVGIGYGVYRLFFAAPVEPPPIVEPGETPVGGLPPAGTGAPEPGTAVPPGTLPPGGVVIPPAPIGVPGVVTPTEPASPIANLPTVGATITGSNVSYYNKLDSKFYRLNPDGTVTSLSSKTFRNVESAKFDQDGEKAILEFPDGANVLFDFTKQQQVTLPKHWEAFDFSDDGGKIAAKSIGIGDESSFLVVANPDGSGAKAVQELGANADKVIVDFSPDSQIVATATTGRSFGLDRKEVYFVGQNHENFKSMIVEGINFSPKWAPSGRKMLYSVSGSLSDYKPMLWVVDAQGDSIGQNRRSIPINTWAEKCSFGPTDRELYCAVPTSLPRGAGLQPDIALSTPDSLVKIDMETGLQTTLAMPGGTHTIGSVMLSADGRKLVFTDSGSGIINTINLAP